VHRRHVQEPALPERWSNGLRSSTNFRTPALLRVCKQFRDEAFGIFLRDNLFSVGCSQDGIRDFATWLREYGPYARHIRYLSLTFGISHDSVYRSFFPGAAPLDRVWESAYVLYVASYFNERPETAVDRRRGLRIDFAFNDPEEGRLGVARDLTITSEAELETVLQPFLRSLDADVIWDHDKGIMDAFKLFVKHSEKFGNGQKLFVELWQQWLWFGCK